MVLIGYKKPENAAEATERLRYQIRLNHAINLLVCRQLIRDGADPNTVEGGMTALMWAAQHDNAGVVKNLVALGADPDFKNHAGRTAMIRAVRSGAVGAVQALLDVKVDVNACDNHKKTALMHAACVAGNSLVIDLLLEAAADLEMKNRSGRTALYYATKDSYVTKKLLEAGANMDVRDVADLTVLEYASDEYGGDTPEDKKHLANLTSVFKEEEIRRTTKAFQDAAAKGTSTSRRVIRRAVKAGYNAGQ
ncbi:MAG: ankyrin repeat domain-containing protein [Alphaproteobacteria bacterium]|nr:ankyrin repeat domain-containing protein [Alphaproteobacteria bacterium]